MKTSQIIDKEKQQIQDKEVFIYRPYSVDELNQSISKMKSIT